VVGFVRSGERAVENQGLVDYVEDDVGQNYPPHPSSAVGP
jgi:hypothetical protein